LSSTSLPTDAWRYTSPQDAAYKLSRISRSEKHFAAFMDYITKSERVGRFSAVVTIGHQRARELGIRLGTYTAEDLEHIYQEQRGCCFYCFGELGKDCETDHKRALSRGGTNALSNIVLACMSCNRQKRAKTPQEYRKWVAMRDQPTLFPKSA
jgi:hypothetical protein